MHDTPHKLSRAMLLRGDLAGIAARAAPEMRLLTNAEREASWRATLAANPDPAGGVWLFGYGSLLWNPTVHVTARRRATAQGWHRAFCLLARAGRGSAANPGLLLGLLPGGRCDGMALRVQEEGLEAEIDLLWRREMLAGSYVPHWVALSDEAAPSHAIAFTLDPAGPAYAGDLSEDEVVARLSTACGELGTCAEYLLHTRDALRDEGIHDPDIERLAVRVLGRQGEGAALDPLGPAAPDPF